LSLGPDSPILKIAVKVDGLVTVNGSPTTIDSLRASLTQLAEQKGVVWYYREAGQSEAPPESDEIIKAVIENRLPIKLSSRSDYSDAIGMDGSPLPKEETRRKGRTLFTRLRLSVLCRRDLPVASARDAIGWWETRRVPFNLIVGSTGIISCVIISIVGLGSYFFFDSDFGLPGSPLFAVFGILFYGIAANVFFTGGWLVELIVRKIWLREADRFATLSFTLGLGFSVLLTLTPGIVVGVGGIFGLIGHLFGVVHTHGL
jgi:hypothetical protein